MQRKHASSVCTFVHLDFVWLPVIGGGAAVRTDCRKTPPHALYLSFGVWAGCHAFPPRLGLKSSQRPSCLSVLLENFSALAAQGLRSFPAQQQTGGSWFKGEGHRGEGRRALRTLFCRNVTVMDVSADLLLLSPPLLRQNMSRSRLHFQGEGMGKYITPKRRINLEWQKITNKARKLWPLRVSVKQLGGIRLYRRKNKILLYFLHYKAHLKVLIKKKRKNNSAVLIYGLIVFTDAILRGSRLSVKLSVYFFYKLHTSSVLLWLS